MGLLHFLLAMTGTRTSHNRELLGGPSQNLQETSALANRPHGIKPAQDWVQLATAHPPKSNHRLNTLTTTLARESKNLFEIRLADPNTNTTTKKQRKNATDKENNN